MQITQALRAVTPALEHAAPHGARSLDALLDAGRLPGTREPAVLDALERAMATGTPVDATRRVIGTGMNNARSAVELRTAGASIDVVEKPTSAQGAQEHFGWLVARELGIDHRVAAVARASDGTARIEHLADADGWTSLYHGGVSTERDLERLLTKAIRRESPQLTEDEIARTARIERQLLQVFDYAIANSDRNLGNGRVHLDPHAVKFFDHGHAGAGQHGRDDVLTPGLRGELQGAKRMTTIDADTAAYLRTRIGSGAGIDAAHRTAFTGANRPPTGGPHARLNQYATNDVYRSGVQARLQHVMSAQQFRYDAPGTSLADPLQVVDEQPMRTGIAQARFGAGGFGGLGPRMF